MSDPVLGFIIDHRPPDHNISHPTARERQYIDAVVLPHYKSTLAELAEAKTQIENQPFVEAEVSNLSDMVADLEAERDRLQALIREYEKVPVEAMEEEIATMREALEYVRDNTGEEGIFVTARDALGGRETPCRNGGHDAE